MVIKRNAADSAGRVRTDYRWPALIALLVVIAGLGALVRLLPGRGIEAEEKPPAKVAKAAFAELPEVPQENQMRHEVPEPAKPQPRLPELQYALQQAESQIAASKFNDAVRTLDRVRPQALKSAQAYHLLGQALQGRGDYAAARDFYAKAIDLDPTYAKAYFDHATASESLGDLESALGGMRCYLHLVKDSDPYRLPVAQARSAIWEWESKLGRGPWGPTKGIPPGFTAEQIKRDGKGVGIMMQKPETLRPDGTMDYEIKAGDRFPELWKK